MYTVTDEKLKAAAKIAEDIEAFKSIGGTVYQCALNESGLVDFKGYNNMPIGATLPGKALKETDNGDAKI
jgi:hypothetical protein